MAQEGAWRGWRVCYWEVAWQAFPILGDLYRLAELCVLRCCHYNRMCKRAQVSYSCPHWLNVKECCVCTLQSSQAEKMGQCWHSLCLQVSVRGDWTHPCSFSSSWSHSHNLQSTRIQNLLVCWYTGPVRKGLGRCGTRRCLQEKNEAKLSLLKPPVLHSCINIYTCRIMT